MKRLLCILPLLSCASVVAAAQFGEPSVTSKAGQPLKAEILITPMGGEQIKSVTMADQATFQALNLPYGPLMKDLSVKLITRENMPVIQITSSRPAKASPVNIAVELMLDRGWVTKTAQIIIPGGTASAPEIVVVEKTVPPIKVIDLDSKENNTTGSRPLINEILNSYVVLEKKVSSLVDDLSAANVRQEKFNSDSEAIAAAQSSELAAAKKQIATMSKTLAEPVIFRLSKTEQGFLGVFAALLFGAIGFLFYRKTPVVVLGEGHKVRILGFGKFPIEGEYIRGENGLLIDLTTAQTKPTWLQRLGLNLPKSSVPVPQLEISKEESTEEDGPTIPSRNIPVAKRTLPPPPGRHITPVTNDTPTYVRSSPRVAVAGK